MPSLTDLLIVVAVAFAAPFVLGLFPRVRLPSVVLEIVAGIVIGPSLLGIVEVDQAIEVIALIGLGFVLFLAGLEIEFEKLRGRVLRQSGGQHGNQRMGVIDIHFGEGDKLCGAQCNNGSAVTAGHDAAQHPARACDETQLEPLRGAADQPDPLGDRGIHRAVRGHHPDPAQFLGLGRLERGPT